MAELDARQAAFAAVPLLANRMQAAYDAQLDDLTLKQWLALIVLHHLPQPVPSTAVVARILGTSHQNVSKLLAALAAKGFVGLEPSPVDGRAKQASLTPFARAWLRRNEQRGERLLDELFDGIAESDLAACVRVLDAMSSNLTGEALTPEAGG